MIVQGKEIPERVVKAMEDWPIGRGQFTPMDVRKHLASLLPADEFFYVADVATAFIQLWRRRGLVEQSPVGRGFWRSKQQAGADV